MNITVAHLVKKFSTFCRSDGFLHSSPHKTTSSSQLSPIHMRREEKPTRCHWMVYYTYNRLNMFRALLCPSSGARDYMCIITAYGVRCLGCWLLEVRCKQQAMRSEWGMLLDSVEQHPSCRTHSRLSCTYLRQPATKASHTIGSNNTHIVSSSWWWA